MSQQNTNCPKFKVVFVGDSTVGKTSLIHRFLHLDPATTSTLGATSTQIETTVQDQKLILNVWDTAGQDTFRNLVPVYAKNSQAAIIVFDQSNPASFDHVKDWFDYLHQHVGEELIICLAGNKSDLESKVDYNNVYQWTAENKVQLIRTSAKDGTNVETLFDSVSQELFRLFETEKSKQTEEVQNEVVLTQDDEDEKAEKKQKKGCCK